ncbi:MAG: phytanoyl-CoA dioxygenase family protein [Candidatus Glassbacteria bacterium]|nr:phytanoyl-CoA dioxygenase family protein [Candidatus Glassbacteria bacterium]
MVTLTSNKTALDTGSDKFGELRESIDIAGDPSALRARIEEDGYLLIRGGLDRDQVMAARREILQKLDRVGEIDREYPLMDAVCSGLSRRGEGDQDEFLKSLRTGDEVRKLVRQGRLNKFYQQFFGREIRPLDYIWVRTVPVGGFTGIHYDWVYMSRGSRRLHTTWIPVGDVPRDNGALLILENSHRQEELKQTYGQLDVDRDRDNNPYGGAVGGWYSEDAATVRNELGGRWLTTDFRAGDMLVFGMWTLHCSLDNNSPENRLRITVDARYQPADEPADERWVGADPVGHAAH